MPIYASSEQLNSTLKILFERILDHHSQVNEKIVKSRLIVRIRFKEPSLELLVNGRHNPPVVQFGKGTIQPELDVEVLTDAFHHIMLGEMSGTKALGSGQLRVRGPVWKTFVLEELFTAGKTVYPDVLKETGLRKK